VAEELRTAGEVTDCAASRGPTRAEAAVCALSAAMELAEALVDGVEHLLAQVGKVARRIWSRTSWLNSASSATRLGFAPRPAWNSRY
jgi:hypothetical protein